MKKKKLFQEWWPTALAILVIIVIVLYFVVLKGPSSTKIEQCCTSTVINNNGCRNVTINGVETLMCSLAMPNPAAVFCGCVGGKAGIITTEMGQMGSCKVGLKTYDDWSYFKNKCPNIIAYG